MSHDETLQQLFPLELGGTIFPVEGTALDRAQAISDELLTEMFPGTAGKLLPRWEALYQITPPEGATIQARQAKVLIRYRQKGDIKKPYFITLAAALGYTILIHDYREPIIGFFAIGDELNYEPWQDFTAAVSGAGDSLGMATEPVILPFCWLVYVAAVPAEIPIPTLETIMEDLKPAHIKLNFVYPEA